MTTLLDELDQDTRRMLADYGFDADEFTRLRERVASGDLSPTSTRVTGVVTPPEPGEITRLPEPGDTGYAEARAAGEEILRAGQAASVVLNGGMATRFGGVVKGVVEAVGGKSFLEVKLGQTAALARELGVPTRTAIMTSFATDEPTKKFLSGRDVDEPLYFHQFVSLRLEPDGSLFHGADGRPSLYAPGHGDFLGAIRSSGTLATLRDAGVRYLTVSNVDNVPARLDPVVLGVHALAGRPVTAEVIANTGEVGGAPARVDGRLRILESMQYPPDFDHSTLPVTNANTMTFDLAALDRDFDLTWLYVKKKVDGREAVQLEHLYHEAARFLPTTYLEVPASGPRGRFLPVKTPADLEAIQPELRAITARPPLD